MFVVSALIYVKRISLVLKSNANRLLGPQFRFTTSTGGEARDLVDLGDLNRPIVFPDLTAQQFWARIPIDLPLRPISLDVPAPLSIF